MRHMVGLVLGCVLLAGCATTDSSADPSPPPAASDSVSVPSQPGTPEPTASPSPVPSESQEPRALFGTWRTTLGGSPLSLAITESTYRIVRGGNSGAGSVRVDGDRIEFFDSSLCSGTGVYRWTIADGTLSFFPIETEPCPGRAEALLVRYPDYSPPEGG